MCCVHAAVASTATAIAIRVFIIRRLRYDTLLSMLVALLNERDDHLTSWGDRITSLARLLGCPALPA
jgi:hypothetical protein